MNTQHTPGPWQQVHTGETGLVFAKIFDEIHFIAEETDKANARLIAAAPDLLEALKEIVGFWDSIVPTDAVNQMHINARAAIAKATTN